MSRTFFPVTGKKIGFQSVIFYDRISYEDVHSSAFVSLSMFGAGKPLLC